MQICCTISQLGHGYGGRRLFESLDAVAKSGCIHLVSGANGSGKSTFLRILSGALEPEKGRLQYQVNGKQLSQDDIWKEIALVAPYQELPEEFSTAELMEFQMQLTGTSANNQSYRSLAGYFGLSEVLHKPIREFSTGMKQKARFVLALGTGRRIWLLDEPGSNLDASSVSLLHAFLQQSCRENLIILASNDARELALGEKLFAFEGR